MVKESMKYRFWRRHVCVSALASGCLLFFGSTLIAEVTDNDPLDRFNRNVVSALTEENADDLALLTQFYVDRDMAPIWVNDTAPNERAHQLVRVLEGSRFDGLNPEDYEIQAIKALMQSNNPTRLAELDLRLSLGLMRFISDLGSGRTEPNALDPELFVYPRDIDKVDAIKRAAEAKNIGIFVGGYRPKQVDYWRLKGVLANYRAMARVGGWPSVDDGPLMEGGERSPRVRQLRKLLLRLRDLKPENDLASTGGDPDLFDDQLIEAVEHFQSRHGLHEDGKVGSNTLRALNTPIEDRIEQMVLNLERRRWMPDHLEKRFIFVNLADFHLQLIEDGKVSFDTPVVIGSEYNKTPVFSSDMTYLVINPYWNVPKSIASGEIIPKARVDDGYFERNGFELFSDWSKSATLIDHTTIDWSTLDRDSFSYKLRQRPGPTNALGRVKFMMPNQYNIYLHDTPDRSHFSANERSFSHGCVRVAEPEALANAILNTQDDWSLGKIEAEVKSGDRTVVRLEKPLPVQLTYLTSWVDSDNVVHFRNDVYDRDQILADALSVRTSRQGTFTADISADAPGLINDLTVAQ